ncbi:MAG: hypothetical protein FI717_06640 [SAR202 cluster bacterium]|nr:hypothetical protein [Chloroflexota bacterium]MQF96229.1 hypothetical protein [SAR202 cluster bacterium]HAA94149.1 hypothetical protein [Dehalococcoidia bacterium]MQG33962.1 hypothetical protein [SAR202 cluster bacterium]HCL25860.1 hypothetical protein [Dehalococcoidia bacterium]|tara:strand:- start:2650 stop:2994 length:345 start_codon:yes stop_codon:yes gene_type:complete
MLVEVEVTEGENSPLDLHRMFDLLSDPIEVMRVYATNPMGEDLWCRVTGWGSDGPCAAMSALAEDSGEGVVLLVYGGDQGVRLQAAGSNDEWDLNNPAQWGEACLMLAQGTPVE